MDFKLRTPNSELRTIFQRKSSFDEILLQLTRIGLPAQPVSPRKVLFWGERVGEISSYVAGWLAGKGMEVIVLDGANRFDPYMVSSFARKALISPERLLKRIRIARAFTCYQMAVMVGERLNDLFKQEGEIRPMENRWVILLGPVTPFLDEDVSEREVRPLFGRSLKKIEEIALRGVPFLLFQSSGFSENPPFPFFTKGGVEGLRDSRRIYLTRRLFEFSDEVWKISLDDQEPKVVLEKGVETSTILRKKHQIPCLPAGRQAPIPK
jgi:hypothetical protein